MMELTAIPRCFSTLLCIALVVLCTSCVSYRRIPTLGEAVEKEVLPRAYVSNAAEYRAEYKMLRYANRYHVVPDSSQADVRIELQPLQALPVGCVTPQLAVNFLSLGFYPVKFVQGYVFSYSEVSQGDRTDHREQINITSHMSWFHLFSFRKSRKRAIGKSLHPRAAARPILLSY